MRRTWNLPALTVLVIALCCCAHFALALAPFGGVGASLRAPVSASALARAAASESALSGEIISITGWTCAAETSVRSPRSGRSATVSLLRVWGDMRRACPISSISGSFPAEDDTGGALIDRETANALFGSADVIGCALTVGDMRYVVRGVIDGAAEVLLIRDESALFDQISFTTRTPDEKSAAALFLYRYGLGEAVFIEYGLYARVMRGAACLPVLLLLLGLFLRAARTARRGDLRALPLCALLGAALYIGASRALYWPDQFLPTRWADLDFWRTLFLQLRENGRAVARLTPTPMTLSYGSAMRGCAASIIAALCASVSLLGGQKKEKRLRASPSAYRV